MDGLRKPTGSPLVTKINPRKSLGMALMSLRRPTNGLQEWITLVPEIFFLFHLFLGLQVKKNSTDDYYYIHSKYYIMYSALQSYRKNPCRTGNL
jgi:hypothetical protein